MRCSLTAGQGRAPSSLCCAHLLGQVGTSWFHGHEINAGVQGGVNPCSQPKISLGGWGSLHFNSYVLISPPASFLLLAWVVFPAKLIESIMGLITGSEMLERNPKLDGLCICGGRSCLPRHLDGRWPEQAGGRAHGPC